MNLDPYLDFLVQLDLLKAFSRNDIKTLFKEQHCKISTYEKDAILYFENEVCHTFDLVLEGEIYVQKIDQNGNVLTVADFIRGDNLGGNLIFSKHAYYPMTIFAKTKTTILRLNKSFVLDLCQTNRDFLLHFLSCISDKTMILTDKIKSISIKTIRESIIDYLNYEYLSQQSKRIQLSKTKKELAERFGIQRSSLSRELSKMKKDGLVDYDARSITIRHNSIIKKNIK